MSLSQNWCKSDSVNLQQYWEIIRQTNIIKQKNQFRLKRHMFEQPQCRLIHLDVANTFIFRVSAAALPTSAAVVLLQTVCLPDMCGRERFILAWQKELSVSELVFLFLAELRFYRAFLLFFQILCSHKTHKIREGQVPHTHKCLHHCITSIKIYQ